MTPRRAHDQTTSLARALAPPPPPAPRPRRLAREQEHQGEERAVERAHAARHANANAVGRKSAVGSVRRGRRRARRALRLLGRIFSSRRDERADVAVDPPRYRRRHARTLVERDGEQRGRSAEVHRQALAREYLPEPFLVIVRDHDNLPRGVFPEERPSDFEQDPPPAARREDVKLVEPAPKSSLEGVAEDFAEGDERGDVRPRASREVEEDGEAAAAWPLGRAPASAASASSHTCSRIATSVRSTTELEGDSRPRRRWCALANWSIVTYTTGQSSLSRAVGQSEESLS